MCLHDKRNRSNIKSPRLLCFWPENYKVYTAVVAPHPHTECWCEVSFIGERRVRVSYICKDKRVFSLFFWVFARTTLSMVFVYLFYGLCVFDIWIYKLWIFLIPLNHNQNFDMQSASIPIIFIIHVKDLAVKFLSFFLFPNKSIYI
jgi:hypothetical protein